VLDHAEPPAGRLWAAPPSGPESGPGAELGFTGWLGLLRALYQVIGLSGGS